MFNLESYKGESYEIWHKGATLVVITNSFFSFTTLPLLYSQREKKNTICIILFGL